LKENGPFFVPVKAGYAVKEGGLTGPVGPNDAVNGTLFNLDVELADGRQPTEALAKLVCRENSHSCSSFACR
jgi:hypothetical protein